MRSLDRALAMIGALALVLAALTYAALTTQGDRGIVDALLPSMFLVYVGAGLWAWHQRPSNAMGAITLVAAVALLIGAIGGTGLPVAVHLGTIGATLIFPAIGHLLLAFPGGRLRTATARGVVIAMYVLATVMQAPLYLFSVTAEDAGLMIVDAPQVVAVAAAAQSVGAIAVMVAATLILVHRLLRARPERRRVLAPLYGYGMIALLFIPFSAQVLEGALGMEPQTRFLLQAVVITGVPLALTACMLTGGFARTGEVEELSALLATDGLTRSPATLLAGVLGDPSLIVRFRRDDGRFVDAAGAPAAEPGPERGHRAIDVHGRLIAEVDYDVTVLPDPAVVDAAARIVAIALDRERLTAELLATTAALRRSRERLVDAADAERRRIARDLHDGLQAQLVMLAVGAQQLASVTSSDLPRRATRLRADVDAAAGDLRRLVDDLMPAALIERGLVSAAEDLLDRMPMPASLQTALADGELPSRIEHTAYFVIAEALSNIVKHARASAVTVRIDRSDHTVSVVVTDDGIGGARPHHGLRGLGDRGEAVGGTLHIDSRAGRGTTVRAEMPCAS